MSQYDRLSTQTFELRRKLYAYAGSPIQQVFVPSVHLNPASPRRSARISALPCSPRTHMALFAAAAAEDVDAPVTVLARPSIAMMRINA